MFIYDDLSHLKSRRTERWGKRQAQTQRESETFHLLVHSSDISNNQGWARLKLRTRSPIQVSEVGSRNLSRKVLICLRFISRKLDWKCRAAGTQTRHANMEYEHHKWQLNPLQHNAHSQLLRNILGGYR